MNKIGFPIILSTVGITGFTYGRSKREALAYYHYHPKYNFSHPNYHRTNIDGWGWMEDREKARKRGIKVALVSALLFPLYWGNKWYYGEPQCFWYYDKVFED